MKHTLLHLYGAQNAPFIPVFPVVNGTKKKKKIRKSCVVLWCGVCMKFSSFFITSYTPFFFDPAQIPPKGSFNSELYSHRKFLADIWLLFIDNHVINIDSVFVPCDKQLFCLLYNSRTHRD